MSVNWVACGTNYTKTELVVIELQCSNRLFFCFCFVCFFFFGRGGGGHVDHLRGHPYSLPAVALWLTRSYVELFL